MTISSNMTKMSVHDDAGTFKSMEYDTTKQYRKISK
jgi:hypothetical protein